METRDEWESLDEGATRMSRRNHGEPTGFSRLVGSLVANAVRRANRKDLAKLKRSLEGSAH